MPELGDQLTGPAPRSGVCLSGRRQDLRLGHLGAGVPPAVPDFASSLDQREGVTRKPMEFPWIALAGGILQCIDSGAAKLLRILSILAIKIGHCSRIARSPCRS